MYKWTLYKCALTLQPVFFLCAHPALHLSLAFPRRGAMSALSVCIINRAYCKACWSSKYGNTTVQHPAEVVHFILKSVIQLVQYSPEIWKSLYAGYSSAAASSRSVLICLTRRTYIAWGQHVHRQVGLYVHLSKPGVACLSLGKPSFQKLHWSCTHGAATKQALSSLIDLQIFRSAGTTMTAINTAITCLMYCSKQIVPATHTACVFTNPVFFLPLAS